MAEPKLTTKNQNKLKQQNDSWRGFKLQFLRSSQPDLYQNFAYSHIQAGKKNDIHISFVGLGMD